MNQIQEDILDYNPDEPFEGLGVLGWFKVIFRTRAQTLKQADKMLLMMMHRNNAAGGEAEALRKTVAPLAKLVKLQHTALVAVKQDTDLLAEKTLTLVEDALAAAHDSL